jgi:hypothetical protein
VVQVEPAVFGSVGERTGMAVSILNEGYPCWFLLGLGIMSGVKNFLWIRRDFNLFPVKRLCRVEEKHENLDR